MKNKIFGLPLILFAALAFASCGNGDKKAEETTTDAVVKAPRELTDIAGVTSYYECPMKCEGKKFSETGNCPICGMELVLVEVKTDSTTTPADSTHQM
ncbi:MAG: heavy metal-binding domain-containing protein [Bacteroidota bacterium]